MFRIVCDPSSGSTELCLTEITLSGSQINPLAPEFPFKF